MSHDIVKDMISVRRGDALYLAMEAASNNVSPRAFEWGFVGQAFESQAAMDAMILRYALSGGIKLQGPKHPKPVAFESLSGELRHQFARLEERTPSRYVAKDAIEELTAMSGNGFYSPDALEQAHRAVDALKAGFPLPRSRKASHDYPMAKSIGQSGLSTEAMEALRADPALALEPAPLGVSLLHRLALQYSWRDDMRMGIVDSARALLAAGADPCAQDALGRTPLHAVAFESEVPAFASLLARVGADIHARDNDGATPLHRAAERGRGDMAQQLLGLQPDANLTDSDGRTALHHAAFSHRVENVAALLAYGANAKAVDAEGSTPLHWAAKSSDLQICSLLVAAGCDPAARDHTGRAPSELAKEGSKSRAFLEAGRRAASTDRAQGRAAPQLGLER